MRAHARRLLVVGLILAAGAAALAVRVDDPPAPALPAVESLTAATGWRAESASPPVALAMRSRQWLLRDGAGDQALLYVGATARARTALDWSGELGYQGEGYELAGRPDAPLALAGGRHGAAGGSTARRLEDQLVLRYAVVGPAGVVPRGRDLALPAAWDLLTGRAATYYAVRVTVADGPGAEARAASALATFASRLADRAARP
jgi:Protein of unknown function (DUF3485)